MFPVQLGRGRVYRAQDFTWCVTEREDYLTVGRRGKRSLGGRTGQSCDQVLTAGSNLILDLTDVSFINLDGVALCRRLQRRQVTFLHCSPFVTELLKG
jgi:hypothetical protein